MIHLEQSGREDNWFKGIVRDKIVASCDKTRDDVILHEVNSIRNAFEEPICGREKMETRN